MDIKPVKQSIDQGARAETEPLIPSLAVSKVTAIESHSI